MTRKHHPHSRAERLALKQELDEKPKGKTAQVRRRIVQALKEQETEDELNEHGFKA